jgi:hypothetical protein
LGANLDAQVFAAMSLFGIELRLSPLLIVSPSELAVPSILSANGWMSTDFKKKLSCCSVAASKPLGTSPGKGDGTTVFYRGGMLLCVDVHMDLLSDALYSC